MALVRQLTTADFQPISKYEYIVSWLSKCQTNSPNLTVVAKNETTPYHYILYTWKMVAVETT